MTEPAKSDEPIRAVRLRLLLLSIVFLALVGLAAAWSWSPLRQWLDVTLVVGKLQDYGRAFGPMLAGLAFVIALTVAVPLTFLTLVTLLVFGPWQGSLISIAAATAGAAVTFLIGKALGHEVVRRIGGRRVNLVSERLASRGILTVIAIRMVPVAPFAIINMIAGATHIRLRDMVLGTAVGMTPGTVFMAVFVDQIIEALKNPSPITALMFAALALLLVGGLVLFRKWIDRQSR
jgi:uncharacterized membrane protein YdjX (TVP38/TMEM64 family)